MPGPTPCAVCRVPAIERKLYEALLSAGVSLRNVAAFSRWWSEHEKNDALAVGQGGLHRHRSGAHFTSERYVDQFSGEPKPVRDMVQEMLGAYQAQKKGKLPTDRDMREWLVVAAKVDDLEQRRKADEELRRLTGGLAWKPEEPRKPKPDKGNDNNRSDELSEEDQEFKLGVLPKSARAGDYGVGPTRVSEFLDGE